MNRNLDTCPASLLIAFAVVLLCLARVMGTERTEPAKVKLQESKRPAARSRMEANGSGDFAAEVPEFKLKDPRGESHTGASLFSSTGMLIMLTVPNLTQYEKQKRWEKWLNKQAWPQANAPRRVLLEDLSQQETFKDKVRAMMAEKYDPRGEMTVLVDEDGKVRRGFGVQNNETVILLVDASGKIVHHESDFVEPEMESARRVGGQVRELAETARPALSPLAGTKLIIADMVAVPKN